MAAETIDPDPQVDIIGHFAVDLARYVKANRLDGRFAVEFSAHHGDIRSARQQREIPLPMPQKPAGK